MIALELISESIPALKLEDTVVKALSCMDDLRISHLPVINEGKYIGLVSDIDLYDLEEDETPLSEIKFNENQPAVAQRIHIYNVMKLMGELNLSVIPIIGANDKYLGATDMSHIMKMIVQTASIDEVGGIVVLQMNHRDYSMAQIAQIIESNGARILSSYITSIKDSTEIEVTLKINRNDLSSIQATFNRYEIKVKSVFHKSTHDDDMKDRYDHLMNYYLKL